LMKMKPSLTQVGGGFFVDRALESATTLLLRGKRCD
jgi:hypothetical protein